MRRLYERLAKLARGLSNNVCHPKCWYFTICGELADFTFDLEMESQWWELSQPGGLTLCLVCSDLPEQLQPARVDFARRDGFPLRAARLVRIVAVVVAALY